ncbi:hypothetical protein [Noviherbaspirillum saxi]|uniref:DUF2889 domain-containing protein n=1 Tax=Noviherbaspirillum saxi TaxID=2320863 RepID=A0A3A3FXB3_9BURK|nr:hypothetical protein [Noviherbaspirillum saxi]RJF91709.1 hypothetical protein D3871_23745 [Noviherbaspirillum saxi]
MKQTPSPDAGGAYRRRIAFILSEGCVCAALEDDYHHFTLELRHGNGLVTGIDAQAMRTPWSTCPSASTQLTGLIGAPVSCNILADNGGLDASTQCTHQFDLALLAIAHAARGAGGRYDAMVTDPHGGTVSASLHVDGRMLLDWVLQGSTVVSPGDYHNVNLRTINMRELAARDTAAAEAVLLLRRAVMVAGGRAFDFDQYDDLTPFATRMKGACYAFQPEQIPLSKRRKGSVRDFTTAPQLLLKDFY